MNKIKIQLIIIGIIAGLINGIFGSGGGIIVVPALVFLIKLEDYKAHATAISIILPLSIVSTIIYLSKNTVPLKLSMITLIGGVLGSYTGAKFLRKIPITYLRKFFGSIIIYTAMRMILK